MLCSLAAPVLLGSKPGEVRWVSKGDCWWLLLCAFFFSPKQHWLANAIDMCSVLACRADLVGYCELLVEFSPETEARGWEQSPCGHPPLFLSLVCYFMVCSVDLVSPCLLSQ